MLQKDEYLLHFCAAVSREIQQNNFCTYFVLLAPPTFTVFAVFVRIESALAFFCNHLRLFGGFCSKRKLFGSNFVILFASFNLVNLNFPLLIAKLLSFAVTYINVIFLHCVVHYKRTKICYVSVLL